MNALARPFAGPVVELLTERLGLLAHPVRARLLDALDREGAMTVQALADTLDATQQNVSNHLRRLAAAGIVDGRRAGREVRYRLAAPGVLAVYEAAARTLADDDPR